MFGPTLHCWSPVDACELIHQHGQPHYPDCTIQHDDTDQPGPHHTQEVTTHEGAADSRRVEKNIKIHIPSAGRDTSYSTSTGCWGPPPADQLLSPQAWSELLGKMDHKLRVQWNRSCPISVKGLLDALLLPDTHQNLRHITVCDGNIASSDLCEWTRRYTQQSVVTVTLYKLTWNLSPDGDSSREDQETAVRALQDTEHEGQRLFSEDPLYSV